MMCVKLSITRHYSPTKTLQVQLYAKQMEASAVIYSAEEKFILSHIKKIYFVFMEISTRPLRKQNDTS